MIFLRDVLGSNVAVRGGNLKQKKGWRGVGGVFLLSVQHGGEYISTVFGYI